GSGLWAESIRSPLEGTSGVVETQYLSMSCFRRVDRIDAADRNIVERDDVLGALGEPDMRDEDDAGAAEEPARQPPSTAARKRASALHDVLYYRRVPHLAEAEAFPTIRSRLSSGCPSGGFGF